MEGPMVQIGATNESVEKGAEKILEILRVGFETRAEQDTIQMALELLAKITRTEGVTLNGGMFVGEQHDHYSLDTEPLND